MEEPLEHQRAAWLVMGIRCMTLYLEWLDDDLMDSEDLGASDMGTILSWLMVYAEAHGLSWEASLASAEATMQEIVYDDHLDYKAFP